MRVCISIVGGISAGLIGVMPAVAQSPNGCMKLSERLERQDQLDKAHDCNLISGRTWRRRTTRVLRRCRRSELARLKDLVGIRAEALERCITAKLANGNREGAAAVSSVARSSPEAQSTGKANRGSSRDRIRDLLASGPKLKPRAPDGNGKPASRNREFRAGLVWSYGGKIPGMHCVQWREPSDPHNWFDNYLCSERDVGFQWSFRGPILGRGLKCIQVREKSDPHDWHDNYFCWPRNLNVTFRFSASGRVPGFRCLAIVEPSDPHTWADNYLCHRPGAAGE